MEREDVNEFYELQLESLKSMFKTIDPKFIELQFKNTEYDFAETKEIIKVCIDMDKKEIEQEKALEAKKEFKDDNECKDLLLLPENEHAYVEEPEYLESEEKYNKNNSDEKDYNGKFEWLEEDKDVEMLSDRSSSKIKIDFVERDYKDLSLSQILDSSNSNSFGKGARPRSEVRQKIEEEVDQYENDFDIFANSHSGKKCKK